MLLKHLFIHLLLLREFVHLSHILRSLTPWVLVASANKAPSTEQSLWTQLSAAIRNAPGEERRSGNRRHHRHRHHLRLSHNFEVRVTSFIDGEPLKPVTRAPRTHCRVVVNSSDQAKRRGSGVTFPRRPPQSSPRLCRPLTLRSLSLSFTCT